jgi:hypothetical protein
MLIAAASVAVAAVFVLWRAPREAVVTERTGGPVSQAQLEAD